jgi:vitamin B12 transporter
VNAQRNEMESYDIPFGSTEFAQSINPDDAIFTMVDPYANVVYVSKFGLQLNAGARLNNHSEYGSHFVYSLNPSFKKETNFGYIKGLASFATAYITPSLYQLFEPTYGNADLKPEENTTFEIGAELHLKDKATFNVVYFTRDAKHFIDFVDLGGFNYSYLNVDHEFTVSGVEITADYQLSKAFRLAANGTYTKADESQRLRIPEIKVNAQLDYKLSDKTFMSLSYQYNDDRTDTFYNAETFTNDILTLENYSLLDFYVSHQVISNKLRVFANVTNILNKDFQEIIGFSTRGRNASLGMLLDL